MLIIILSFRFDRATFWTFRHSLTHLKWIIHFQLLDPIYENSYIRTVKLPPNNNRLYVGETGVVSGFGWNSIKVHVHPLTKTVYEVGSSDNILRYAHAKILNQSSCQKTYVKSITERHICAQVETTADDINGVCSVRFFDDSNLRS